jgi:hypothetical protein
MKQKTSFRVERMKAAEKDKKGNPTRIRPLAEQAGNFVQRDQPSTEKDLL